MTPNAGSQPDPTDPENVRGPDPGESARVATPSARPLPIYGYRVFFAVELALFALASLAALTDHRLR